jgi:RNA polymerase sigma-70 factor, ECF subfamily
MNETDEALMLAYSRGDTKAFERLYRRHKDSLYRYVVRQVSNTDLAHDLYQDIWSRIIQASSHYSADAKWTTWAYRIAHNLTVDHYRKLKPLTDSDIELESSTSSPERTHSIKELEGQLSTCMDKLPSVQLETFLLSQETDLTLKMIAEVVSASHEAVKTRLRYARQALQTCLSTMGVVSAHSENEK